MGQRIRDEIIFAGSGLDTDSDIHFLRKGDTDERWNLIPSGEGSNHVLSVVKGNYEISNSSLNLDNVMQNPVVVGSCHDSSENMYYYFLCDDNDVQAILRYNVNEDEIERVLVPTVELAYGRLYNWYAVDDARGLAPSGWHVPTKWDWDILVSFLGMQAAAGGNMKTEGIAQWKPPNTGGADTYGFSAHAAGFRNYDEYSEYSSAGFSTILWSADEHPTDADYAYGCYLTYNSASAIVSPVYEKTLGCSVRLIRDDDTGWVDGEQVTDEDGNVYDTVRINKQIWMTSNFMCTKYANGDDIDNGETEESWDALNTAGTGAVCVYNNKPFYAKLQHLFNNLGLSKTELIHDACVIGDYLFWNPRTSSPRMINIRWAMNLMEYLYIGEKSSYSIGDYFYYKGRIYEVTENAVSEEDLIADITGIEEADDAPAPAVIPYPESAVVENAAKDDIVITFSASLDGGSVPDVSAFDVADKTISAVNVSGTDVTVTVTEEFEYGESIFITYTQPVSNPLVGATGGIVGSFDDFQVTNNILYSPVPEEGEITYSEPNKIYITFDENLDETSVPHSSAFVISPVKVISDVTISCSDVVITVSEAFASSDDISVSYTKPGINVLKSVGGGEVESFNDFEIDNNISTPYVLALKYTITRPLEDRESGKVEEYQFTVMNTASTEGAETFVNNFRVLFSCYIAPDGLEYTNNYALSSNVTIDAGGEEDVTATFSLAVENVNWNRQYAITIYYDSGTDNWVQLGTRTWNVGL